MKSFSFFTALSGMIDALTCGVMRVKGTFAHAHTTGRDGARPVSTTTTRSRLNGLRVGILVCGLLCAATLNAQVWHISGGVLTISGTGAMTDWVNTGGGRSPWHGNSAITSVIIQDGVTSIGNYAFYECTGITSVTIPNSIISIGRASFFGCTGLTSLTIPNSVTTIGESAFSRCTGLTSINVAADNANYISIDGVLFNKNMTTLIKYPGSKQVASYIIPNSVTRIGEGAFGGCTNLTSVTIGNSVTFIASAAFEGCTGLASLTIPNSVTSIAWYAFAGCTGLTSLTIGNSVSHIGNSAFADCTGLVSLTLPASVAYIEVIAFAGCTGLRTITSLRPAPPNLEANPFSSVIFPRCTLFVVPEGLIRYQTTAVWNQFFHILPIEENTSLTNAEELFATANPLRAWARNGLLHITGVAVDETLSIYTSSGVLVYQNPKPASEEIDVNLTTQGVYIVQSGGNTVRVVVQ